MLKYLIIPFMPIALGLAWLTCASASAAEPGASQRPNIVFIMADDAGVGDIAAYPTPIDFNSPVPTPHLDGLVNDGMVFNDAHSPTALCSPTRWAVMTGKLNYRSHAPWGIWQSFRDGGFKPGDVTLGRVMQDAGYRTGFIGKWHLGGDFAKLDGSGIYRGVDRNADILAQVDLTRWVGGGPLDLGFDESLAMPCGIQGPLYTTYEGRDWLPLAEDSELVRLTEQTVADPRVLSSKGPGPGDSHWDTRTVGELLGKRAATFIHDHANDGPFFLCYWSPEVHKPHLPPDTMDGKSIASTTPTPHTDMVRVLDQEVGMIVQALKQAGVYDNTLIVFSSDNGGLINHQAKQQGHDASSGWRGYKNQPYEGGHRVPLIAVWPDAIEPGSSSDTMVNLTDLLATFAAIAERQLPAEDRPDSLDLSPVLHGDPSFTPREILVLQAGANHELIYREGPWKLIIQSDHPLTKFEPRDLFNLDETPLEPAEANLIDDPAHQERVQGMLERYLELRESGAPTVNPGEST